MARRGSLFEFKYNIKNKIKIFYSTVSVYKHLIIFVLEINIYICSKIKNIRSKERNKFLFYYYLVIFCNKLYIIM